VVDGIHDVAYRPTDAAPTDRAVRDEANASSDTHAAETIVRP
jgi:hypothetical protein